MPKSADLEVPKVPSWQDGARRKVLQVSHRVERNDMGYGICVLNCDHRL